MRFAVFLSFLCLLGSILLLATQSYPICQHMIPNGFFVPNPCNTSELWPGVGHQNKAGGGPRNLFGLAFIANGYLWTVELCNQDSDNDSLTNGWELGDPNCTWHQGDLPWGNATSNPGTCDPYDSPHCQSINFFLNCDEM